MSNERFKECHRYLCCDHLLGFFFYVSRIEKAIASFRSSNFIFTTIFNIFFNILSMYGRLELCSKFLISKFASKFDTKEGYSCTPNAFTI